MRLLRSVLLFKAGRAIFQRVQRSRQGSSSGTGRRGGQQRRGATRRR